ncbi:MAG: helix-turn-helix transcriptional regulator, partial [Nocardioidaceae bacterium]
SYPVCMGQWSFITNHARVLLLLAGDPDARLRDLAAALDITERTAYGIVTDLVEAGYLIKYRGGRRNRYHIQEHLPLPDPIGRERTIGEVLELLAGRHVSSAESSDLNPATANPSQSHSATGGRTT